MTLQHVTLELRLEQVDACVVFYELLGFRRVEPPPSLADRAAWLERNATQIHLQWVDDPVVMRVGHAAVVVDAFEETMAALRDAGHEPERRREHWGAARAHVFDPAGNRIELMAAPPPAG